MSSSMEVIVRYSLHNIAICTHTARPPAAYSELQREYYNHEPSNGNVLLSNRPIPLLVATLRKLKDQHEIPLGAIIDEVSASNHFVPMLEAPINKAVLSINPTPGPLPASLVPLEGFCHACV